jgi:hypothetical protein
VLTRRNGAQRGKGLGRAGEVRTTGRGRRSSARRCRRSSSERLGGSSAVDGEQGREESVRKRELGEGERKELGAFIER